MAAKAHNPYDTGEDMDQFYMHVESYLYGDFAHRERVVYEIHACSVNFDELNKRISKTSQSFSELLLHHIDKSGKSDPEIYKAAGLDRKHFSKIRSNEKYRPKKDTVICLAFALRLGLDDTSELLEAAGYNLSPASERDLLFTYMFENHIYDLFKVNAALFEFDLKVLPAPRT